MGRRDLDSSLDDIIKNKKDRKDNPRPVRGHSLPRHSYDSRNTTTITRGKPRMNNVRSTEGRGIQKSSRDGHLAINNRLGGIVPPRPPSHRPRGTSERPQAVGPTITRTTPYLGRTNANPTSNERNKIDPSSLVITKTVIPQSNNTSVKTKIPKIQHKQLSMQNIKQSRQTESPASGHGDSTSAAYHRSKTLESPTKTSIVLLCNLDPRATAEDVGETCSMFGPILSCDMLLDPMGRPLYEAEVEFMYPQSAEDCVSKLDGEIADGRVLRARLQFKATPPVVPRYSSRTVGASARIEPRYNDTHSSIRYMPYSHHPY